MFNDVIEFIRRLFPNDEYIPLHAPSFMGNEKKYVLDAIDSTFVSVLVHMSINLRQRLQNMLVLITLLLLLMEHVGYTLHYN